MADHEEHAVGLERVASVRHAAVETVKAIGVELSTAIQFGADEVIE
jgi:hypothetical protein